MKTNLNLVFLCPYSPKYNPIEKIFSLLKRKFYRKIYKSLNSIENDIKHWLNSFTREIYG